jgi:hypothetical protein
MPTAPSTSAVVSKSSFRFVACIDVRPLEVLYLRPPRDRAGHEGRDKTFKTYLDGYNFLPLFKGDVAEGPRKEFFYFSDADLMAVRYGDWKLAFKTIKGNLFTGSVESTNVPLVANLRQATSGDR